VEKNNIKLIVLVDNKYILNYTYNIIDTTNIIEEVEVLKDIDVSTLSK
jgi:plastocyanin domain-containing protein